MRAACALLALAAALGSTGCSVKLDDPYHRGCDRDHACVSGYWCEEGQCIVKPACGIGAWSIVGSLPSGMPRQGHAAAVLDGAIYLSGGCSQIDLATCAGTAILNDVWRAQAWPDGGLGDWALVGKIPTGGRHSHAMASWRDRLYIAAGSSASADSLDDVLSVKVVAGDGGATLDPSSWVVSHLPVALHAPQMSIANDRIYVAGGSGPTVGFSNAVFSAGLSDDGSVGSWQVSNFDTPRASAATAAYAGHVMILGGFGASGPVADVDLASVSRDGSLPPRLEAASPLPQAMASAALVTYGGCVHLLGGLVPGASQGTYATIDQDLVSEAPGADARMSWSVSPNHFFHGRDTHAAVSVGGYAYVLGGIESDASTVQLLGDVQSAPFRRDP